MEKKNWIENECELEIALYDCVATTNGDPFAVEDYPEEEQEIIEWIEARGCWATYLEDLEEDSYEMEEYETWAYQLNYPEGVLPSVIYKSGPYKFCERR